MRMGEYSKIISPRCEECGEDDFDCLDNHHVYGKKNSKEPIVLCANCHRKLHVKEKRDEEPKQRHSIKELWDAGLKEPTEEELWNDELWR